MDKRIISRMLLDMAHMANSPLATMKIEQIIDSYAEVLADVSEDMLKVAALHYKSSGNFFPQPGQLRMCALELMVTAAHIPSPAEAWGYVLQAPRYESAIDCTEGDALRHAIDGKQGGQYWQALAAHTNHKDTCEICSSGGYAEDFIHPAVKETVRLLGGRDILMTDNPAADRARFIEAYREIVGREEKRAIMHPQVREHVAMLEERAAAFDTGEKAFTMREIRRLTDGMK